METVDPFSSDVTSTTPAPSRSSQPSSAGGVSCRIGLTRFVSRFCTVYNKKRPSRENRVTHRLASRAW